MRRPLKLRTTAAAAAAIAVVALAAPGARADSIAYVQDGNVHLSTPDGARKVQVTTTGGYSDVSQADDGTMIALHGVRLHRLDRTGTVLADFDTPVSDTRPAAARVFHGPFDPAISPDGTKVAYTYYYMTQGTNPSCFPPQCVTTINEGGTGYSHADRQTAWDEPGLGRHSGWRHPAWIDDANVMISNPTHAPNYDVLTDTLGDTGVPIKEWFSDDGTKHLSGGDMSRTRDKVAFAAGENDSEVRVYRMSMTGAAPALPEACFRYSAPAGQSVGTPTLSPDGSRLAWAQGDGIRVASVPSFAGGCTTDGASAEPTLLLPGATEPDWGPADVPAARPTPAPGPTPVGGTTAPGGGPSTPGGPRPQHARLAVRRVGLRAALRSGLTVELAGASGSRVTLVARRGSKVVARGSSRVRSGGTATVRLRFTRAARRALRPARRVSLTLEGAGASRKVTLRR